MRDCILWEGPVNDSGYGRPGGVYAHRAAYAAAYGPIPTGACVLHACDVRRCVNPSHLFLGTRSDNLKDMWSKGRGKPKAQLGEKHGMARLNAQQVLEIRASSGPSHEVAPKYGISPRTVRAIRKKKLWAHLP